MRAKLKGLHSPDVNDLKAFEPEKPRDFAILLQAFIGADDSNGEESFDIHVCTPAWLEQECKRVGVVSGRHKLIVEKYNFDAIEMYIRKVCERASGGDWDSVAAVLRELGCWEFDGYQM